MAEAIQSKTAKLPPIREGLERSEEIVTNILLVDDHPPNLLALDAILSPLGQRLISASSGGEALEVLMHEPVAVVLLDVRMPGLDGFTTAGLIRSQRRDFPVPLIFLTAADTDPADIVRGYQRGAVDFLMKPFEPEVLRSKVAVFVELYRQQQLVQRQAAQLRHQERTAFEHRSATRFRELLDAVPICVVVTDSHRRPSFWNQRALAYTGIVPGRAGHPGAVLDLVHPDEAAHFSAEWTTAERGKRQFELKFRLRGTDGRYRWHLGRGVPQLDENQHLSSWILSATDIEDQQQALTKAETANQIKDEFLALVSHELRNPLNAIIGWVHVLRNGSLDQTKTRRAIETIERNVNLQVSLIDEILDLSRIVRNKVRLRCRPLDLAASVQSALTTLRPAAEAKQLSLEWEPPKGAVFVNGDPERLQQVIGNLVSNAIKFTPQAGRVRLELERGERQARLAIGDNGVGISPEFLPHVFDAFRQADSGTTRQHMGLGLGLAISKQLIELHGGSVSAASAGINRGASFVVTLPLLPDESLVTGARSHRLNSYPRSLNGLKILIVDDDPDTREILSEILGAHGAEVLIAGSAGDALAAITSSAPDVLVSDIAMPGEDGLALVRAVRRYAAANDRRMVLIALTGLSAPQHRELALAAGFEACMNKPLEPTHLIDYIVNATNR